MEKNYYKLIISYDGTDYQGWQEQPNQQAVANMLKNIFKDVFQRDISLVSASRTDAGVHALGQMARIKTDLDLDPNIMKDAWNNRLPSDIVIRHIENIDDSFHPQQNVEQKTYEYTIFTKRPLPFVQRYGWFYHYDIDIDKLKKTLQVFVGTHDFRSFCTGYEQDDTVRTIDDIMVDYQKDESKIIIAVKGQRFLYHMIRRLVGAAVAVASHKDYTIDMISKALQEKNPEQTLPNAPAKGLLLQSIRYKS